MTAEGWMATEGWMTAKFSPSVFVIVWFIPLNC